MERNVIVTFKVSENELQDIDGFAHLLGLNRSQYIRLLCANTTNYQNKVFIQDFSKKARGLYNELFALQNRINNFVGSMKESYFIAIKLKLFERSRGQKKCP